ncbi:MAG: D-alanyl-D-alanine carboxypeptidase [Victivallales bacterium]|nr:D-alanyl-D-alanine carboxypeptidase [Victivallales bacterium]
MNTKVIILAVAIVVLIHLLFFAFIIFPHRNKTATVTATENTTQQETTAPETQQPTAPPSPAPPSPAPPSPATPAPAVATPQPHVLPKLEPYSPSFFRKDLREPTGPVAQTIKAVPVKAGCVVDLDTRTVFWEQNPDEPLSIASVSKMMTAYLAIRKLYESNGAITLETPIRVTRDAARIGGREVWLDPKETFTFEEILKCVLVHSANDAAYLLAEFCADGSIPAFLADMNAVSQSLGCDKFHFVNTNGLTEKDGTENSASAIQLAYLSEHLIRIPEIMRWTGVKTDHLRENDEAFIKRNKGQPTMLSSSNGLLGTCKGCNGMKTGYTTKSGFCIVATCERSNRRIAAVILGAKNAKERDKLARSLIDWAYTLR